MTEQEKAELRDYEPLAELWIEIVEEHEREVRIAEKRAARKAKRPGRRRTKMR